MALRNHLSASFNKDIDKFPNMYTAFLFSAWTEYIYKADITLIWKILPTSEHAVVLMA